MLLIELAAREQPGLAGPDATFTPRVSITDGHVDLVEHHAFSLAVLVYLLHGFVSLSGARFLRRADGSLGSLKSPGIQALTSARFVLSKYLAEHVTVPTGKFSIRDWMETGTGTGTGNVYITWREDMKEAMKPLVSTWVDVFCSALLSLPESYYRRWWLVIDELASMEKLASLADYLTKGRRKGGCCVAGLQTVSQLDDIFGEKMAQTLRASFRSLVVLRGSKTDPATAEEMSKALGEHEVARPEYTDSRNPGSARNTSERMVRSTERVVTPAQIQTLPDLTGWVPGSNSAGTGRCRRWQRLQPGAGAALRLCGLSSQPQPTKHTDERARRAQAALCPGWSRQGARPNAAR